MFICTQGNIVNAYDVDGTKEPLQRNLGTTLESGQIDCTRIPYKLHSIVDPSTFQQLLLNKGNSSYTKVAPTNESIL